MHPAFALPPLALVALFAFPVDSPRSNAGDAPAAAPAAERSVLEFEWKLRYRPRFAFLPGAVDQWAGARLELRREGDAFALVRPRVDPWVLRRYPGHEATKLGTQVAVAGDAVVGHPYAALAPNAERQARERNREWRDDPFWADCRCDGGEPPPVLADDPVYPFWILGDLAGGLRFRVDPVGRAFDVRERLSEPWLPDGWEGWKRGDRRAGTGYWARERPGWEPRIYPAIARALEALDDPVPLAAVAAVAAALNPRARGQLAWDERVPVPPANSGGKTVAVDGGRFLAHVERTRDDTSQRLRVRIESARDPCRSRVELTIGYAPPSNRSPALPSGG